MYYGKRKSPFGRAMRKKFLPWWMLALGILGIAAASGAAGAIGSVLDGVIGGSAGLTIEQAVVIDRENLTNLDLKHALDDAIVAVNDEGTSVTVAAEMHVGEELVFDLPLANNSDADVNMIARIDSSIPVLDDIEVFWNTLSRSTSPAVTNSTPSPTPLTAVAFQSSDTTPSTTTPPGVAGINAQVSDGIATTSSPGLPVATAQAANAGTKVTTMPTGTVGISAQTDDASATGVQPTGAPMSTSSTWYTGSFMAALDSDGVVNDTINFVLTDVVTPGVYNTLDLSLGDTTYGQGALGDSNVDSGGDDERITVATDIVFGAVDFTFTATFDSDPTADTNDARVTAKTWYTGSWTIDSVADGTADDTINFALSDANSNGVFDNLDISLIDMTYGSGSLSNGDVTVGDDERITASTDIEYGTANYVFTTAFDSNPEADADDARITSKTKFENAFDFDADASGALNPGTSEKLYWGLSDLDSNGLYDAIDFSLGGTTFGQGALGDTTVTSVAIGGADDDEQVTVQSTKVKIGTTYSVLVNWAETPASTTSDASILLTEDNTPLKFLGLHSWVIDANGDLVADDHVFFVISDTDSDGVVDTMDISIGDKVFGEGALGDGVVDYSATDNTNDERISSGEIVTLGTHNFLVEFDTEMFDDEDDARIIAQWYTGTFPVDVDNDRADNTLDFVILDHNSDGLYTVFELDGDDSGAYTDGEVHYGAASTTLMWFDPVTVHGGSPPTSVVGQYTSIDVTSRDDIFISYYDVTNGDLRFAKSSDNGQNWSHSTVDTTDDVGQHTSIEALSAMDIYISYYDVTDGDLLFARTADGGSTWTTTTIDSTDDVGQYSSISATSTSGHIYVSYYDATDGDLKVARSTDMGATWTVTTVDSTDDVGQHSAIDTVHSLATTTIYVSYYDATSSNLKSAVAEHHDFPTFTTSVVDSVGDVGQYSSLVAVNDTTHDNGQSVYISYYDATNADLRVATSTDSGASFSTTTAVSSGDVGKFSSIAAVEPTTVFISYFEDAPVDQLDKIKTTRSVDYGITWSEPALIEEGNSVGQYNDIALFGTSNAYVSYWEDDDDLGHLKFAKSPTLIDLFGHRVSLDWSMNPTLVSNAILYDGRILNIAQLNRNEWLFIVPKPAVEGPSIEQTQIRIRLKGPDDMRPGFYTSTISLREYEG